MYEIKISQLLHLGRFCIHGSMWKSIWFQQIKLALCDQLNKENKNKNYKIKGSKMLECKNKNIMESNRNTKLRSE